MSNQVERVKEIVEAVIKKNDIKPDDVLSSVGVTSMNVIQILSRIENVFDVEIPGDELNQENLMSIVSISNLIDKIRE